MKVLVLIVIAYFIRSSLLTLWSAAVKMEVNRLKNTWPLQRLKDMVSHAQNTSKESWKDLPVLSSSFTEVKFTIQADWNIGAVVVV